MTLTIRQRTMETSSDTSSRKNQELDNPAEIYEVLRVACSHGWPLIYTVRSGQRTSSHTAELLKVEPQKGTLTLSSDVKYSGLEANVVTDFRSQSGGIRLEFQSSLLGGDDSLSNRLFSESRIRYPERMRFNQLRHAARIDCNSMDEILVSLFTEDVKLQGKVQDLSTTGVKVRFEGNLSYQFKNSRMVTDCRMRLPDGSLLGARLKILGFFYDSESDISYIRCYFLEIRGDEQMHLKELINSALENMPQSKLVF